MEFDTMAQLIRNALEKHPLSRPQDIVKLLYQSEFGPAHAIDDPKTALRFLREEYAGVRQEEGPLCEYIGGGYVRLDLKTLDFNGVTPEQAAEWFVKSAAPAGDKAEFAASLRLLADDPRVNGLMPELAPFIAEYISSGCPAVHHSGAFRTAYSPAYRVVRADLLPK